jgi:lipid A 4'-phosphatase
MHHDHRRQVVVQEDDEDDMTFMYTRLIWAGLFFALAIFAKAPGLDLLVAANYYNAESGFFHRDSPMVRALYDWTPPLGRGLIAVLVVYSLIAPRVARWFRARGKAELAQRCAGPLRRGAVLALCCALLGPGLLIEGILKNTMGRPRPVQVEQFGGPLAYHAPFVPGDDIKNQRSFVSSHAAAGFALIGLGLACGPVWRRRWLLIGIVTGGVIGLGRMMQGGHFISDIIFSFYVVWLSCEFVALIDRRLQHRKSTSK